MFSKVDINIKYLWQDSDGQIKKKQMNHDFGQLLLNEKKMCGLYQWVW